MVEKEAETKKIDYRRFISDNTINYLFGFLIEKVSWFYSYLIYYLITFQCKEAIRNKEVPVACVFWDYTTQEKVCWNHNLTNKLNNATAHAEMNCIEEISNKKKLNLDYSKILVIVSCEPCIM